MVDQPRPHNGAKVVPLRPAQMDLAAAQERVRAMAGMCYDAAEEASRHGLDAEADQHFTDAMALSKVLAASGNDGESAT